MLRTYVSERFVADPATLADIYVELSSAMTRLMTQYLRKTDYAYWLDGVSFYSIHERGRTRSITRDCLLLATMKQSTTGSKHFTPRSSSCRRRIHFDPMFYVSSRIAQVNSECLILDHLPAFPERSHVRKLMNPFMIRNGNMFFAGR